MSYKMQQIECPVCHNTIFINIEELLKGRSFTCANCNSSVSLSSSSKRVVEETMEKFEQIRITHNSNH